MRRNKIGFILAAAFILLPANIMVASAAYDLTSDLNSSGGPAQGTIDLDVKDVDIKEIARVFSRVSGLNFVVSDDVQAKVTFKGSGVEWEKALDMILKTYSLTYVREGNFLRIITYNNLQMEEEGVPLADKVVFLNFARAEELLSPLNAIKSNRGRLNADLKTNSLVITDTPDKILRLMEVIKELDRRTPQVMIEAMIVSVKLDDEDTLGIDWTLSHKNHRTYATGNERSFSTFLPMGGANEIRYGKTLLPLWDLTATIDLWVSTSKATVLANPKILTLDTMKANIEIVSDLSYRSTTIDTSTGGQTTTYSFRPVGIKMEVTPHISSNGMVALDLKTEQSYYVRPAPDGQPIIDKRLAETNLMAGDGETIVIGGLRERDNTRTVEGVPVLKNLPFIGRLFRNKSIINADTELLIFVTPYIVSESQFNNVEQRALDEMDSFLGEADKKEGAGKGSPYTVRPPAKQ